RIIQTASRNHLGGKDIITNTNLFSGEVETSRHEHWAGLTTQPSATILTTNIYDHVGRLVETKKKVNSQPEVIQSRLSYNGIGQLTEKKLHSENSGTSFLTTVGYQYNERGWQSRAGSPQFTYQLNYHKNGNTVLSNAQYNGNIAQQLWGHAATTNSTFTYSYDALNRLKSGASTGTVMIEALTYDDMGNIRTLRRDNGTVITYNYNNSQKSNRLASLSGGLSGSFTYDLNGNATKDRTGMNFAYNHLNLPRTVSKAAAGTAPAVTVNYLYDALGTKLRRTATVGTTTTQQDYIGSIEYRKTGTAAGVIERISTEEGYLQNSGGTYAYHYNLTDHLGNVRVVLKRGTSATAPEVVQRQDYYPFGKTRAIVTGGINRYLYNGKEMQADLNGGTHALGSSYVLEGQLDYGARFYDAEIGRWNVVDKEAERYERHSPYAYVLNRPTVAVDPDGKRVYFVGGANNDQDGWNYIQRWGNSFRRHGVSDFRRVNMSNGKAGDIAFTSRYRDSAHEPVMGYLMGRRVTTGKTRPVQNETINKTVAAYQEDLKKSPLKEGEQFNLAGYSYGSVLQAQVALKLANSGQVIDNLILIGSPISDDSDLYKELSGNKNIKNVLRYDLEGDALSNPQGVYDFLFEGGIFQYCYQG